MRTPQEYIEDMTEEILPSFMSNISSASLAVNDQYHADVQRMARNVGLNPESQGYKACLLLAADVLDGLAASLQESEVEDKETGAYFIREAGARLRLLTVWGSKCQNNPCLDLR